MSLMGLVTQERAEWEAYKKWLQEEAACAGCGMKYSERPRDENGRYIGLWSTETECWKCFEKRIEVPA